VDFFWDKRLFYKHVLLVKAITTNNL
jgi:hypothetical protein